MDSFFIFRLPGGKEFEGGVGCAVNRFEEGFVVSSFSNEISFLYTIKKHLPISLSEINGIADSLNIFDDDSLSSRCFPFPKKSTEKIAHINGIHTIIRSLEDREKTVSCRVITGEGSVNLEKTILSLSESFPHAMVFCFFTPQTGLWIGASPEKLFSISGKEFSTMSLAGTRPAGTQVSWDAKNLEEQEIVTNYISDTLASSGLNFDYDSSAKTMRAGSIEHLCTRFHGVIPNKFDTADLQSILGRLSPTPALCGFPKEKSLDLINQTENFKRGYYGGYFGFLNAAGDCSFYVLLRSIRIEADRWCMFAGGGITKFSIPEEEWIETERKSSGIIQHLIFN